SQFDRLSLEIEGLKLELARSGAAPKRAPPAPAAMPAAVAAPAGRARKSTEDGLVEVKSPLLGVFYRAPKPGEPPFVEVGARVATRTVCIGPSQPAKSYLSVETVVQAALGYKCDAIHPGYGFLSERADMARLCEAEGVIFIGPTAAQIEAVGDKLRARSEAI